ncbi:lama1 [Trichonephila clavipes]|nr:lama1 [Trichonephila clavipes]
MAKIVNGVYGADTVTANYVQFWFRRFRSGIFDVKDALRTGRPVVKNVDKITVIIEVDWHNTWFSLSGSRGARSRNLLCRKEGSFWVTSVSNEMQVLNRSRQNDRLRMMLVLVHIDITPPHTPLPLFRRIGERTIPYSWRASQTFPSVFAINPAIESEKGAIARRIRRRSQTESWIQYVSSITSSNYKSIGVEKV